MTPPVLYFVVPCYNEQEVLDDTADKLQEGFRADVWHQCQPQPVMAFLSVCHAVFPFA